MEVPEDEEAPGQLGGDVERQRHWSRSEARFWFVSLFCGTCLLYCARMAMPVCAVSMATAFHWSKIDTGLVLGGFFWGYCFTQILGGHASDKVGGERVLVLSAALWSTVTMVTPLLSRLSSHSVLSMTLARFLMGLLQGVFFPSLASLCSQRVLEAERGSLMSAIHSGTYLGTLLAGGLGSVLLELYSWELLFYSVGAMSGLWALVVSNFLLRDEKVVVQKKPQGTMSRTRWLSLCQKPSVWSLVLAHTCMSSSSYMLLSWLPTYFDETFPMESGSIYNVVPWLVAIPVVLCSGWMSGVLLSRGHSLSTVRKVMQFIAMAVSSLFLVLLSGTTSITAAVTYVTIAVSASTFSSCGTSVNVQDLTPSCAGALYGFMNMLGAFMGLLTVSFSGYLIEVTSSWAMVFSLITLINTVGLGIFLVFGDTRRVDLDLHSTVDV
ncbi:solute carrier family 17 member 9-like [Synchiropus splendidus]|uniref:solute carrier family 17 member 9-like n=1 Tax=Synchiropus splendidus TaxID=270530 RepID=UPI00237E95E6|nr:solute carrier family 17 member 9-like [Synchiropus splendidus]